MELLVTRGRAGGLQAACAGREFPGDQLGCGGERPWAWHVLVPSRPVTVCIVEFSCAPASWTLHEVWCAVSSGACVWRYVCCMVTCGGNGLSFS